MLIPVNTNHAITVPLDVFRQWIFVSDFAVNFYLDRIVSINHSWHQKTRGTGLPDGADCIHLHSLILTRYGVWWTDGRTDRFAIAYTGLVNELALPRCKTENMASSSDIGIQFSTKYRKYFDSASVNGRTKVKCQKCTLYSWKAVGWRMKWRWCFLG